MIATDFKAFRPFKLILFLVLISACYAVFFLVGQPDKLLPAKRLEPHAFRVAGWLALGELRGYIEPCGCNPASDLGGLRRLGSGLFRLQRAAGDLTIYDLGNNLEQNETGASKNTFIIEGLSTLGLTARLVNHLELDQWGMMAEHPSTKGEPFVLSNTSSPLPHVQGSIVNQNEIILGIVEPRSGQDLKQLKRVDLRLLAKMARLLEEQRDLDWVLLYSGSDKTLELIHAQIPFDRIITSNNLPLASIVDNSEREKPGRLLRMKSLSDEIYMVPVGGQGILRGGAAQENHPLFLTEILGRTKESPATCKSPFGCDEGKLSFAVPREVVTWLDRRFEAPNLFSDLFARYNDAAKLAYRAHAESRLHMLDNSSFAGVEACASCHAPIVEKWRQSAHARAYQTLVDADKSEDPSCVSCHVVGFYEQGGFVSIEHSPQLANVQCENCHGPRKEHVQNPFETREINPPNPATCTSCHHGNHSPGFLYEAYWPKIEHGL